MKFILQGPLPAKKNTLMKGKYGWYNKKTKALESFILQLKAQKKVYTDLPIKVDCRTNLSVYGGNRQDLNNEIVSICDLLEKAGIVSNDRNIKHIEAHKYINRKNPHTIIIINPKK